MFLIISDTVFEVVSEAALRAMFLLLTTAEPAAVNAGSAFYYYLRPPHEDPRRVFTCAIDAHHLNQPDF